MFFGVGKNMKTTREGEDLNSPSALTDYLMDTFLCSDFQLKSQTCMEEYKTVFSVRLFKRRKMHKQCMNYLDEYKACLIGMNQQQIGAASRSRLSEQELYLKRLEAKKAKNEKKGALELAGRSATSAADQTFDDAKDS